MIQSFIKSMTNAKMLQMRRYYTLQPPSHTISTFEMRNVHIDSSNDGLQLVLQIFIAICLVISDVCRKHNILFLISCKIAHFTIHSIVTVAEFRCIYICSVSAGRNSQITSFEQLTTNKNHFVCLLLRFGQHCLCTNCIQIARQKCV